MAHYIGTSPYSDASEAGESIAKVFAAKLLELPMLRYQLLEKQREQENEQAYRRAEFGQRQAEDTETQRHNKASETARTDLQAIRDAEFNAKLGQQDALAQQNFGLIQKKLDQSEKQHAAQLNQQQAQFNQKFKQQQDRINQLDAQNKAMLAERKAEREAAANRPHILPDPSGKGFDAVTATGATPIPSTVQQPQVETHGIQNFFRGIVGKPPIPDSTNGMPKQPLVQPQSNPMPAPQSVTNAPAAMIRVRHPNGQTGTIPASALQQALQQGYTQIQ